ncbi:cytochrome P450 monooxygenase TRI13 [Colletotrichum spaethianum]|uniref:Cytochrome P450 monooxygenase TRI13 n=1 Tax=Colletotrichum spaethianum TaxID=700344 RepID=A0AA37P717_9PEZI|nr:cytochrome P450 monooxygenase TRI13 [Colletotrichum spaethianum]GKT41569.1 cytochrome P450 monooxygenase TRI13 [Colletotrichum spaethianum]
MTWLNLITAIFVAVAVAMRLVYPRLLPKPIPGIPCNKESTTRLLGDAQYFIDLDRNGKFWASFFTDLLAKYKTPIAQYFPGPFEGTHVVIGDYREARDLMTKRGKDLGRGYKNNVTWQGVLPEHFIAMDDFHPSFKEAKFLTKDLMTPSFLHGVSAPASYKMVMNFINLWKVKAVMAKGLPFDAAEDLEGFTYDIMMTAAFGIAEQKSHTLDRLRTIQKAETVEVQGNASVQIAKFPHTDKPELLAALNTLNAKVNGSLRSTIPRTFHAVNNFRPSVRRAFKSKRTIIQSHIDRSVKKLSRSGLKEEFASAVDYVVSRERFAAESAGRPPAFNSLRMNDMLWGYLVGGQESTHSTLCFTVKYLGANHDAQSKLRRALHLAYPKANDHNCQPTIEEIIKTQVPFLDAFIEETLRMCSPAAAVTKEALCDMMVLGYVIPKGTPIMFLLGGPTIKEPGAEVKESKRSETSQKLCGEGVDDWSQSPFPPGEFHVERWLQPDENGDITFNNKAGPFMSFSSGLRGCWGKRLAYLELKLIVTLLVWNLEFNRLPTEMENNGLVEGIFTKPKSCLVKLESSDCRA